MPFAVFVGGCPLLTGIVTRGSGGEERRGDQGDSEGETDGGVVGGEDDAALFSVIVLNGGRNGGLVFRELLVGC
jgi:hypothetical protein